MKTFLSIKEAAEYLEVEYKTVYRLVRQGALPAGKVGGVYRIRAEDIETYFEAQKARTMAEGRREDQASRPPQALLRCGSCFRLLPDRNLAGGPCQTDHCEELLCRACWQRGERLCGEHLPTQEERLKEALADLKAGRIPLLVRAIHARQREMSFMARFE